MLENDKDIFVAFNLLEDDMDSFSLFSFVGRQQGLIYSIMFKSESFFDMVLHFGGSDIYLDLFFIGLGFRKDVNIPS